MTSPAFNQAAIAPAWNAFQNALPVKMGPIRTGAEYDRMVAFMNSLVDVVGEDEEHHLADLLELVGQLVEDYDDIHHTISDAPAREVLQFLMEQQSLKQTDLSGEIGGQSVVSDILNGKREINARQAKALGARFGVSAAAFL